MENHACVFCKLDNNILTQAIYKSILIKRKYVLKDEKEKLKNSHSRAILNFGHTFGHALETFYKFNQKFIKRPKCRKNNFFKPNWSR